MKFIGMILATTALGAALVASTPAAAFDGRGGHAGGFGRGMSGGGWRGAGWNGGGWRGAGWNGGWHRGGWNRGGYGWNNKGADLVLGFGHGRGLWGRLSAV